MWGEGEKRVSICSLLSNQRFVGRGQQRRPWLIEDLPDNGNLRDLFLVEKLLPTSLQVMLAQGLVLELPLLRVLY
jgi:hypothetical protein